MKRNERKREETKGKESKRKETKRNERKPSETKGNETNKLRVKPGSSTFARERLSHERCPSGQRITRAGSHILGSDTDIRNVLSGCSFELCFHLAVFQASSIGALSKGIVVSKLCAAASKHASSAERPLTVPLRRQAGSSRWQPRFMQLTPACSPEGCERERERECSRILSRPGPAGESTKAGVVEGPGFGAERPTLGVVLQCATASYRSGECQGVRILESQVDVSLDAASVLST